MGAQQSPPFGIMTCVLCICLEIYGDWRCYAHRERGPAVFASRSKGWLVAQGGQGGCGAFSVLILSALLFLFSVLSSPLHYTECLLFAAACRCFAAPAAACCCCCCGIQGVGSFRCVCTGTDSGCRERLPNPPRGTACCCCCDWWE